MAFNLKAKEYTLFSSTHVTFSRRDHMRDHKTCPNKFKKNEIISSTFFNHNVTKPKSTTRKKLKKTQTHGG